MLLDIPVLEQNILDVMSDFIYMVLLSFLRLLVVCMVDELTTTLIIMHGELSFYCYVGFRYTDQANFVLFFLLSPSYFRLLIYCLIGAAFLWALV